MGEPALSLVVPDEAALAALAGRVATAWRAAGGQAAVSVGLCGDLGAGKTTWVRAMLRALGFDGRVPSPTYTLMEIYEIDSISLIHMDLYRIADDDEFAALGVRDYEGRPGCWLIAEWPQRAGQWFARCDIVIDIAIVGPTARRIDCTARPDASPSWLQAFELT